MAVLTLSDDLLEPAKRYAVTQALSLDEGIARLIALGLERACENGSVTGIRFIDGFGEFAVPSDTPVLTTEDLLRIEDEY